MQFWSTQSSIINVNELNEKVRIEAQPTMAFSQVLSGPDGKALGKNKGDRVQYIYYPDVDTAGGELSEYEEVPSTGFTPVEVDYQIKEYGNSIAYRDTLEKFARIDIEDVHVQALINDYKKLQNTQAYNQFALTDWVAGFLSGGDVFETDGSVTGTVNEDLSLANLSFVKKKAEVNNIPYFDGESYVYITGVEAADTLESDSNLTNLLKEDSGRAALNGEIGRVKRCRVVIDNHKIAKIGATQFDEGFLIGADAVLYDIAEAVHMEGDVKDMGRHKKLGYLELAGYHKIMDQTSHSKEHIIHVTN